MKTNKQTKHVKQTTWKHERNMHMHEDMIPKADKKSSKESLTLDRKNYSNGQTEKTNKS